MNQLIIDETSYFQLNGLRQFIDLYGYSTIIDCKKSGYVSTLYQLKCNNYETTFYNVIIIYKP